MWMMYLKHIGFGSSSIFHPFLQYSIYCIISEIAFFQNRYYVKSRLLNMHISFLWEFGHVYAEFSMSCLTIGLPKWDLFSEYKKCLFVKKVRLILSYCVFHKLFFSRNNFMMIESIWKIKCRIFLWKLVPYCKYFW